VGRRTFGGWRFTTMTVASAASVLTTHHVSTSGAALIFGCTRLKVLNFAARGLLTPVPMAGRVFFERAQVEALRDQLAAATEREGEDHHDHHGAPRTGAEPAVGRVAHAQGGAGGAARSLRRDRE
jgi:hypothetical protein